jgi:hypothetical protein
LSRFSGSPSKTESRSTMNMQPRKCAENIIKKMERKIFTNVLTAPVESRWNAICVGICTFLPGKQVN